MRISAINTQSTLEEWKSFQSILNNKAEGEKPLIKKSDGSQSLIYHLSKQFSKSSD